MGLPPDIEAKIAAAEKLVEDDLARIQESIDGIDAIPVETFDDPSIVRCVDAARVVAKAAPRAARASRPPFQSRVGAKGG